MIFCDTSALAKYYVDEPESAALKSRLDSEEVVIASELGRVELMSTFHRQLRERKWNRGHFQNVAGQFNQDDTAKYWTWLPLSSLVISAASQLSGEPLSTAPWRPYDRRYPQNIQAPRRRLAL